MEINKWQMVLGGDSEVFLRSVEKGQVVDLYAISHLNKCIFEETKCFITLWEMWFQRTAALGLQSCKMLLQSVWDCLWWPMCPLLFIHICIYPKHVFFKPWNFITTLSLFCKSHTYSHTNELICKYTYPGNTAWLKLKKECASRWEVQDIK